MSEAMIVIGNKQPGELLVKESIWLRLPGVRPLKRAMCRRSFEGNMAKLVNSALGHESEGLARGAEEYVILANMAQQATTQYCQDWGVNRRNLEAQIPAIRKLNTLATPAASQVPKFTFGTAVAAIVGLGAALFAVGVASGLCSAGYHIVINHLVR